MLLGMKMLIVYASKYGQTAKIATAIAEAVRQEGVDARAANVASLPRDLDLRAYDSVVVAGPFYFGHMLKPLQRFVKRNLSALALTRTALIAVSLSAKFEPATAEELVHTFVRDTGWLPETFTCVAGAESFTKYGFFTTWIMRKIARQQGRGGDFTKDREYTDFGALTGFMREFVAKCRVAPQRDVTASAAAVRP